MNKHIQIRNVPEGVYRTLKERAAANGMSLSAYLRRERERNEMIRSKLAAKQLAVTEIFDEIRQQGPVKPKIPIADIVRTERESR